MVNFISGGEKRRFESQPDIARMVRKRYYITNGDSSCPHCDSFSLKYGKVTPEHGKISQEVSCNNCLNIWTDIYTLTNVIFEDEK